MKDSIRQHGIHDKMEAALEQDKKTREENIEVALRRK
jgi:hypothetical protein